MSTNRIDYAKIILVGFVLFIIIWIVSFLVCGNYTHNLIKSRNYSLLISLALMVLYYIFSVKYADKIKATIDDSNDTVSTANRNLKQWEVLFAVFLIIYLIVSSVVYGIYSQTAGKIMMALAVLFKVIEGLINRRLNAKAKVKPPASTPTESF